MYILMLVTGIFIFLLLYFYVRTDWVFRKRIEMIYKNYDKCKKLPSFNKCVFKYFLVWDINKLVGRK